MQPGRRLERHAGVEARADEPRDELAPTETRPAITPPVRIFALTPCAFDRGEQAARIGRRRASRRTVAKSPPTAAADPLDRRRSTSALASSDVDRSRASACDALNSRARCDVRLDVGAEERA